MKLTPLPSLNWLQIRRLLALPLSVTIGGLLVALVLAGLRAGSAAAAAPAEPAVLYACTSGGLDSAVAAGGSATFNCVSPTTVTVSALKNVVRDVTLDGGNKLILSGNGTTDAFSVGVGIHLNLLNLTLQDSPVAIINSGLLNATGAHFISDTAATLENLPGATAIISGSTVTGGYTKGGALFNGQFAATQPATLTVNNSTLHDNRGGFGAAIFNENGPVNVNGSTFYSNHSYVGGAIFNQSTLRVNNSQFFANSSSNSIVAAQLPPSPLRDEPASPVGIGFPLGGGAIAIAPQGDTIIAGSAFTENFAADAGGAIVFGAVPVTLNVNYSPTVLAIQNSLFDDNCTAGPGGALAANQKTTIVDSTFSHNFAEGSLGCAAWAADHPSLAQFGAPALVSAPAISVSSLLSGTGGAIFSSLDLAVTNTSFLSNTAAVTPTGGGGAIANYINSNLQIVHGTFQGNAAVNDGGAIYNDSGSSANVAGSSFTGNTAEIDAGGAVASVGMLNVQYSWFIANSGAPGHGSFVKGGGAIFQGLPLALSSPVGPQRTSRRASRRYAAAPQIIFLSGLTVDHSTFISNSSEFEGGAIDALNAKIYASTFQSNTARYGGAIDVIDSGFTISASAFIDNAAVHTSEGSAVESGAIDMYTTGFTDINIINSTFFGNHVPSLASGGAIDGLNATIYITNSTFLSNTAVDPGSGGAFADNANFVLHNTLVAFNSGENCSVALTLSGANLEFPGTTCGGATVQADPKILPPANNGGPTLTSALLASSPAINAGDDLGCPSTDQRGAHRPVGPHCDIGAFEFGGQVPWLWLPLVRK